MSKKVLLTGISGYIGHHCALELLKNGYSVRGSVRNYSKSEQVIKSIKTQIDPKTNLEFWDNRNKNIDEVILKLNKQNCAGCIINLRGNDGCLMSSVTKCLSLCFRPNGHWIAVKKISDGGIYNLNSSLKNGPIQINKNEQHCAQ